jgi:hypothetical protein
MQLIGHRMYLKKRGSPTVLRNFPQLPGSAENAHGWVVLRKSLWKFAHHTMQGIDKSLFLIRFCAWPSACIMQKCFALIPV